MPHFFAQAEKIVVWFLKIAGIRGVRGIEWNLSAA
jgi:hypothetical protein